VGLRPIEALPTAAAAVERRAPSVLPLEAAALAGFGSTLVVAPHPDDESLGCGGLIALLQASAQPVWPLLVSDGSASHPRSLRYDAAARTALRDREWQAALAALGVPAARLQRLGCADGAVPGPHDAGFAGAVVRIAALISWAAPGVVVVPWRRDPHPDHRAAHALATAALRLVRSSARCLEYTVWTAERAAAADLPNPAAVRVWRLDIESVVAAKRRAIAAHRSQLGLVIDDDPAGFTIAPAMRARCETAAEYFIEAIGTDA
jgi:LmbE family N-acetylglucosaminyl deacetylase